jgi:hypothetical protein
MDCRLSKPSRIRTAAAYAQPITAHNAPTLLAGAWSPSQSAQVAGRRASSEQELRMHGSLVQQLAPSVELSRWRERRCPVIDPYEYKQSSLTTGPLSSAPVLGWFGRQVAEQPSWAVPIEPEPDPDRDW